MYFDLKDKFQWTFGVPLKNFFDKITGFDVVAFDEDFVKAEDGVSTRDAVQEKWGDEGVEILEKLIKMS